MKLLHKDCISSYSFQTSFTSHHPVIVLWNNHTCTINYDKYVVSVIMINTYKCTINWIWKKCCTCNNDKWIHTLLVLILWLLSKDEYDFQEFIIFVFWQIFGAHSELLGKGFALSHPPTIMQALEGNLPFCWQSNERSFLKDFVACNPGTSGGRLAR